MLSLLQSFRSWCLRLFDRNPSTGQEKCPGLEIVMYTRIGCHLCEEAWAFLQQEQSRWGYELREQDVDQNPELRSRYGECVPVVTIGGKLRFRGRVNPLLFRRLLRQSSRKRGGPDQQPSSAQGA